jgi:hypothetical protein
MPSTPLLSPNPYVFGTAILHTAYATCLVFQTHAPHLHVPWAATPTPLVCARLLGYMIIHSPTPQGCANICTEINSCGGDRDKFYNLAKFYVDRYLGRSCKYQLCSSNSISGDFNRKLVRSTKGRTPVHSDRPSFNEIQETNKYLLQKTPKSHAEAKAAVT